MDFQIPRSTQNQPCYYFPFYKNMPNVLDIDNLTKISYIKEKGCCFYIYRVNNSRIVVKILTQKTFKEKREVN